MIVQNGMEDVTSLDLTVLLGGFKNVLHFGGLLLIAQGDFSLGLCGVPTSSQWLSGNGRTHGGREAAPQTAAVQHSAGPQVRVSLGSCAWGRAGRGQTRA